MEADNPRRLARAIAVKETTGRSLAAWQAETTAPVVRDFRAFWLQRPKAELDGRIETRVEAMLRGGWVEEVGGLIARHGRDAVERFPGIGYAEIARAVESEVAPDAQPQVSDKPDGGRFSSGKWRAVAGDICVATRQYAKRQLTWFRREPTLVPVTFSGAATVPPALASF